MDRTLDRSRRSWAPGADAHPAFPIQNLPLGVFSPPGEDPRGGVAIGDYVLDLRRVLEHDLAPREAREFVETAAGPTLNGYMALPPEARRALREAVSDLLASNGDLGRAESLGGALLHRAADCRMHLPARIGDYTDFYAGIHHARAVGALFRPENPLLPNYKYVPIGYHGRASSIRLSGEPVRRPSGQLKAADQPEPVFGPCRNLDFELELGAWVGPGNAPGQAIPIADAGAQVVGLSLLNDWSARDVQTWEYQPLGPFLAKNFATTISPWIVTAEALEPFRTAQAPRPEGDPAPLPHLFDPADQAGGAFDITLEVWVCTEAMRRAGAPPQRLSRSSALHMYWTFAQLVAHHASNGCDLQPGDFLGSGTISAPNDEGLGSLLEMSRGGRSPISLANGETRTFLQAGDEIALKGFCEREGFRTIGFGECRATIQSDG